MRRPLGNPRQYWLSMIRITLPRERAVYARVHAELMRVAKIASDNVLNGAMVSDESIGHNTRLRVILTAAYANVMPVVGSRIIDAVGKQQKSARDVFEDFMADWIRSMAARRVEELSRTTAKQLAHVIATARSEGLSTTAVASRIRGHFGETIGRSRAMTIARTEVHSAANAAQEMATQSLGRDDAKREWIAASDERTRDDHNAADGQVVGVNEPFDVGGEALMYPGDPSGSPEQIVNCRCVVGLLIP